MMFGSVLLWVIIPIANFMLWFRLGQNASTREACANGPILSQVEIPKDVELCPEGTLQNPKCEISIDPRYSSPVVDVVSTKEFDSYRSATLASMEWAGEVDTLILKMNKDEDCTMYLHQISAAFWEREQCFAVARVSGLAKEYNVLRFEFDIDEAGLSKTSEEHKNARKKNKNYIVVNNLHNKGHERPTGYFRKVPKERGRERVREKLAPFLDHFDGERGIVKSLRNKLAENGLKPGDDVVVMVVNEGEIDLYLNLACSCKMHDISTHNFLVFAASSEIVTMIESTGAMGLYHEGYGSVSRSASMDYLDRVFVDMMWYKAFSVYLLTRDRYNVLFQDADLVWFREPFTYFKEYIERTKARSALTGSYVEAFLSDDGQRSLRYAPFYGNSGFYYLLGTPRSEYFTWSIMISFDAVQVLGSHQNVFTTKMVEGLAISHQHVMILPLYEFPTGILYHHDLAYMRRLAKKQENPYHFHMCWTQGKPDKLIYLRNVKMWYLKDMCSPLENLTPSGVVFGKAQQREFHSANRRWMALSQLCCMAEPGAP